MASKSSPSVRPRRLKPLVWGAVGVCAVLAWVMLVPREDALPEATRWTTAVGATETVTLPDGTRAVLEAGSVLVWLSETDAETRDVALHGAAAFVVPADARPFRVQSEGASARVWGTGQEAAFHVWARDRETRLTVRRGRVVFAAHDEHHGVLVTSGSTSSVWPGDRPSAPRVVSAEEVAARAPGAWAFYGRRLDAVLLDLSAGFGPALRRDPSVTPEPALTATYQATALTDILDDMCRRLHLRVQKDDAGYVLLPAP